MAHPARVKKRTEHINFGEAFDGIPAEIHIVIDEVTRRRQRIEEALNHTDDSSETIINYLVEYIAVVRKTLQSIKRMAQSSSRLRFKWTNFLHEEKVSSKYVDFDVASILVASGLWHMDHASQLISSMSEEEENEEEIEESLHSLKTAAGIFECLKSLGHVPHAWAHGNKDIDASSIRALYLQSLAEGQCVIIDRAIKRGDNALLISQLCADVADKYSSAAQQPDDKHHLEHKWATYLRLQSETYLAISRCFQGISLLEAERCGDSIAVLNRSTRLVNQALMLAEEYDKIKPKTKTNLGEVASFVRARKLITEKMAKSERENSMKFHQNVPKECPSLIVPKCLVQATAFHIPQGQDLTL